MAHPPIRGHPRLGGASTPETELVVSGRTRRAATAHDMTVAALTDRAGSPIYENADRGAAGSVHVRCGIRTIPYARVERCRPGAVIVLPWHPGYGTSHALRPEVQADGTAEGKVMGFAGYMMMRSQRPRPGEDPPPDEGRRHYRTALDPRVVATR